MNSEALYQAMGKIREDYVTDAHRRTDGAVWVRRGIAAACLLLVTAVGIGLLQAGQTPGVDVNSSNPVQAASLPNKGPEVAVSLPNSYSDDTVLPITQFGFEGRYYELVTDRSVLAEYGLPQTVTADAVGSEAVGTALCDDGLPLTLYPYLPRRDGQSVYAAEKNGSYVFALFCCFMHQSPDEITDIKTQLAVCGIGSVEDIASLRLGDAVVTEPERIEAVYRLLVSAEALSGNGFQQLVFGGKSEAAQQALSRTLAESAVSLRLTAKSGAVTDTLFYYPAADCIGWGVDYYRLNGTLH